MPSKNTDLATLDSDMIEAETETADNLPAQYDALFAAIVQETKDSLTPAAGNYIATRNQRFTLPDNTILSTLDCIIVDFIRLNVLMPPYQPNVRSGAKCWAINRKDAELAPGPQVPNPISNVCISCPNNEFGSHGKGKACTNRIRLIIAPSDATKDSDVWIVHLAPTTLAEWTNYVKRCEREIGSAGFCRTLTRLSFAPNVDYTKIQFARIPGARPDPKIIMALREKAADVLMLDPPTD